MAHVAGVSFLIAFRAVAAMAPSAQVAEPLVPGLLTVFPPWESLISLGSAAAMTPITGVFLAEAAPSAVPALAPSPAMINLLGLGADLGLKRGGAGRQRCGLNRKAKKRTHRDCNRKY
jgi:hypothetical protein